MHKPKHPTFDNNTEQFEYILKYARLAPSSHNTQPWTVRYQSNNIIIGYDPDRQLRVGDPNKRELFISLGCFVENITLVAAEINCSAEYKFISDETREVAIIKLSPNAKHANPDLKWSALINKRRSDRRLYEKKEIPSGQLSSLDKMACGNAQTVMIDRETTINYLSKMTYQATLQTMASQDFRDELAGWVRHNWTKKHDGMPGYTQGMPGPISLFAKTIIRKINKVAADQAKKDAKRVKHSAAICIIYTDAQTPDAWIDAGRLYQRLCLEALKEGIKTSAVSAAVIVPETAKQIKSKLQLKAEPVALLRLGYTKNTVKSAPKLSIKEFVRR